jgi:hypothetical protein
MEGGRNALSFEVFVQNLGFCPNPNCTSVVKFSGLGRPVDTVKCDCGKKYCFACCAESHNPISCEQLQVKSCDVLFVLSANSSFCALLVGVSWSAHGCGATSHTHTHTRIHTNHDTILHCTTHTTLRYATRRGTTRTALHEPTRRRGIKRRVEREKTLRSSSSLLPPRCVPPPSLHTSSTHTRDSGPR